MITRIQADRIEKVFFKGKAIVLTGAQQVGKTTMLESILEKYKGELLTMNGDDTTIQNLLNRPNTLHFKQLIGITKLLFIDEAQGSLKLGLPLKLLPTILRKFS